MLDKMNKIIKSNTGSSMILVLSIILILTSFGTIALFASLTDVQTGFKYRDVNNEYYVLDTKAEGLLKVLDTNILQKADDKAQIYMKNSCYASTAQADLVDFSTSEDFQQVMNDKYIAAKNNGTFDAFLMKANNIIYFYCASYYIKTTGFSDVPYTITTSQTDMGSINPADGNTDYTGIKPSGDEDIDPWAGYDSDVNKIGFNISVSDGAKQINSVVYLRDPAYTPLQVAENVPYAGNPIWSNAVTASGSIRLGSGGNQGAINIYGDVFSSDKDEVNYESTDSAFNVALSDGNSGTKFNKDQHGSVPGNGNGIWADDNTSVNLYGNVYSRGDLHVVGDNASINVNNYDFGKMGNSYDKFNKFKIYNGYNCMFVKAVADMNSKYPYTIDNFTKGFNMPSGMVPFLYPDDNGGNVYCNNLSVEATAVTSGNITVNGNVWTDDDIQMDGKGNSNITVEGNDIGLRSTASDGDPNASSSVTNNQPTKGGTITLMGDFIVPGTSYLKFDASDAPDNPPINKLYYQRMESISGNFSDLFTAYSDTNNISKYSLNVSTPAGATADLYLSNSQNPLDKLALLYNFCSNYVFNTNVTTKRNASGTFNGYTLGAILSKDINDITGKYKFDTPDVLDIATPPAVTIDVSGQNRVAYNELKASGVDPDQTDVLANIFISKTEDLGTNGKKFDDLVDYTIPDSALNSVPGVKYLDPSTGNTYAVGPNDSGIIFSKGDLHLTNGAASGTASFSGTIICDGSVTIDSGIDLYYNESDIIPILQGSAVVRQFFSPKSTDYPNGFGMGDAVCFVPGDSITAGDAASRVYADVNMRKRYQIENWIESTVTDNN